MIQGYRDTGIQGYRGTGVQGYRVYSKFTHSTVQGYRDTGIQGYTILTALAPEQPISLLVFEHVVSLLILCM